MMTFFGLFSGPINPFLINDRSRLHNNHAQAVFDAFSVLTVNNSSFTLLHVSKAGPASWQALCMVVSPGISVVAETLCFHAQYLFQKC